MIGRKRSMLASWIACSSRLALAHALDREVDDHDAVLLHDAHQHEHADEGVERRLLRRKSHERRSPPTSATGSDESTVIGCR